MRPAHRREHKHLKANWLEGVVEAYQLLMSDLGAGSVVTKDIPANEIWGGNPAHFIRSL